MIVAFFFPRLRICFLFEHIFFLGHSSERGKKYTILLSRRRNARWSKRNTRKWEFRCSQGQIHDLIVKLEYTMVKEEYTKLEVSLVVVKKEYMKT